MKEIKVLDHGIVKLIDHYGSDSRIADAARTSYQKGTKTVSEDRTLIRYLIRNFHTSPLEQVEITFFCRMPLAVSTQFLRHRMFNFNFESLRYSEASDLNYIPEEIDITFQDPNNKQGGTEGNTVTLSNMKNPADFIETGLTVLSNEDFSLKNQFEQATKFVKDYYNKLVKTGMRRELARFVIPQNQYTDCYLKGDLNNLFKFWKLRLDPHSQFETRQFAKAMYDLSKPLFPIAFEAFENYILDSITLTSLERAVIADIYSLMSMEVPVRINEAVIIGIIERYISNKREKNECLMKIKEVFKIEF